MIAFAAMAALQDRRFVAGVQLLTADDRQCQATVRRRIESPETAIEFPGVDRAAAHARAALLRQIEPLLANGRRVKQAAYEVQHKEWSRAWVTDGRARLALVKQLATQRVSPSQADTTRLFPSVSAQVERRDATVPSPAVVRGLALAALALAGDTGEDSDGVLNSMMTDARSRSCLHRAKLNLFQCMAVGGPHDEDIFCISQHAMLEAGQCMASAAGPDAAAPSI